VALVAVLSAAAFLLVLFGVLFFVVVSRKRGKRQGKLQTPSAVGASRRGGRGGAAHLGPAFRGMTWRGLL
jgi:hypothetical protein